MDKRLWLGLGAILLAGRAFAGGVAVGNYSFELPAIDPSTNPFLATNVVDSPWVQEGAPNTTGAFYNTDPGHLSQVSGLPDHIDNLDGNQGAFISGSGSAGSPLGITQILGDGYTVGLAYTLTVEVGVSAAYAPAATDDLRLTLFYMNGGTRVDVGSKAFTDGGLTATELVDCSVTLPAVEAGAAFAGQAIGIAIESVGGPYGFWDVDNVRVEAHVPGDVNDDGVVNGTDFAILAGHFGQSGVGWSGGDFNGDGVVDFADFATLSNGFGEIIGAAEAVAGSARVSGVPEPASLFVMGAGTMLLCWRRRRRGA